MLSMNLKKILIIAIAILTICTSLFFGIHWLRGNRAREVVFGFLNTVVSQPDIVYKNYIHPYYEGSLNFIEFLSENRYNIGYSVLSARKVNKKEYKVSIELQYSDRNIPLSFLVIDYNGEWVISHMPEYKYIPAALFLEGGTPNRNIEFDIRGDTVSYTCTYPFSLEKWTPLSLHVIDECIVNHEVLKLSHISKVLRNDNSTLEDIYLGDIYVSDDMAMYTKNGQEFVYCHNNFVPIGAGDLYACLSENNIVQLVVYDGRIPHTNRIRVLINTSSHESKYHTQIDMLLNASYTIKTFDDATSEEFKFNKGEKIIFKPADDGIGLYNSRGAHIATAPRRWHIEGNYDNIIYMQNIKRSFTQSSQKGTPYRGSFEITMGAEGLLLINEIDIEEYLYSVVTSEMPVSFGLEALKVQAITARAYAIAALNRPGFAPYGAHLDDSTASQMYNNTKENPTAIRAVQSTYGLVPFYDNNIVDTRFFSTSCGYTAAFDEVWSDKDGNFPSSKNPYLMAKPQYTGDSPSLYNEDNFRAFIDKINNTCYDRFSPFFRWSVQFSREELEGVINHNLPIVQMGDPEFILTRTGDNNYVSKSIPEDTGRLLNISVIKRGQGGNIMELELSTTSGTYRIKKELNIRNVLKPINYMGEEPIKLKCHDGNTKDNFPILPSAFAYIDVERDTDGNINYITIVGGGYGHGVGMSQYGTYGLTLLGKNYIEIMEHYYPGCQLKKMY